MFLINICVQNHSSRIVICMKEGSISRPVQYHRVLKDRCVHRSSIWPGQAITGQVTTGRRGTCTTLLGEFVVHVDEQRGLVRGGRPDQLYHRKRRAMYILLLTGFILLVKGPPLLSAKFLNCHIFHNRHIGNGCGSALAKTNFESIGNNFKWGRLQIPFLCPYQLFSLLNQTAF